MGAGTSGAAYSISHSDEKSWGKFYTGFAQTAAVGALVGAATAGAGSWMAGSSMASNIASASRWVATAVRVEQSARNVETIGRLLTVGGRALFDTFAQSPMPLTRMLLTTSSMVLTGAYSPASLSGP